MPVPIAHALYGTQELPPDPQALPPTGDCVVDNIFYGATPPGGEDAPVLLFVHGLSGLALDWWTDQTYAGLNEMYSRAYAAGYRTAFVNLNVDENTPANCAVERRPANDNYVNGQVLSQQLTVITEYYAVDKVDIIAHSKGGIDAQTAIVWFGAWSKVRSLFTLGTPHQGSILVDQLWSPEGAWLAVLLGQLDDATYALQTPVMQQFRAATDPVTIDDGVALFSGAGSYWDVQGLPIFRLTGNWLQNHPDGGDNDAVVTVASTYLPGATQLFLEPWTHIDLYMGQNAFSRILPYLPVDINGPASLAVAGPGFGVAGREYVFTATAAPSYTTTPLTYTWQVTDLATLQVVGSISDTRHLRWQQSGWKAVRVTVANGAGTVTSTQYLYVFPTSAQVHTVHLPVAMNSTAGGAGSRQPAVNSVAPRSALQAAVVHSPAPAALNQIARGGMLDGPAVESFPIEPQATTATILLLVSDDSVSVRLQAPDGEIHSLQRVSTQSDALLAGAVAWQAELAKPQPGDWQLLLEGPGGTAYYALVTLDSPLKVLLTGFPAGPVAPGESMRLRATVRDAHAIGADRSRVERMEIMTNAAGYGQPMARPAAASDTGALDLLIDGDSGLYGASVRITGATTGGYRFERSFSRSLLMAAGD